VALRYKLTRCGSREALTRSQKPASTCFSRRRGAIHVLLPSSRALAAVRRDELDMRSRLRWKKTSFCQLSQPSIDPGSHSTAICESEVIVISNTVHPLAFPAVLTPSSPRSRSQTLSSSKTPSCAAELQRHGPSRLCDADARASGSRSPNKLAVAARAGWCA
jgi:hypothetical protein